VCPWNEKFAVSLREEAFRPRPAVAGTDAHTLARELLDMSDDCFRIGFQGSPMKRAKLRGLKRNSAVVLGNIGSPEDVPALVARSTIPSLSCAGTSRGRYRESVRSRRWERFG